VKITLGIWLFSTMYAVGELPALGDFGPFAQFGSIGVLGWVAWMLFGEIKENRKERMEGTKTMAAALTDLREHCATQNKKE